jgi:hypothetical protein
MGIEWNENRNARGELLEIVGDLGAIRATIKHANGGFFIEMVADIDLTSSDFHGAKIEALGELEGALRDALMAVDESKRIALERDK